MRNLTQSEKKVLELLEQNCRLSSNQIAKQSRLSPEGVIKIINRLQTNKIIIKFSNKINYSKIGFKLYPIHLKLKKVTKKTIQEIKSILKSSKTNVWYRFCEGEYDLLLSFKISDEYQKKDMNQTLNKISKHILEKDVSLVLSAFELSKPFTEKKKSKIFQTYDCEVTPEIISEQELKLINCLKENSRTQIIDIAKKLKMSSASIITKIKKLQKQKIITGFKTKINVAKLNYQPCIALLTLGPHTKQDLSKFITYCQLTPGIHYLVHQIGKYDVDVTFDVINVNEFYKIIEDIRNKFEFIEKVSTLIAKDI
ncbi:Lrp/AsnC family transcriptional regulator [Candidatus Woesearchaeota archaeon]|jgi:Lrp/AsnC family transcriptional regulator, leucine-responsive regulatory protein|nr:Lrp/AsnC family transcriptional regulator [Candidatus Woesearchaeota archaeon]